MGYPHASDYAGPVLNALNALHDEGESFDHWLYVDQHPYSGTYFAEIMTKGPPEIRLTFNTTINTGRLTIMAQRREGMVWPEGVRNEITVALTKRPYVVARDILRRLLPDVRADLKRQDEMVAQSRQLAAQADCTLSALERVFGVRATDRPKPWHERGSFGKLHAYCVHPDLAPSRPYGHKGHISITAQVSNLDNGVELNLHRVPPAVAEALCRRLMELIPEVGG